MSDVLQIVKYFTDICLEKNLDKIIEFCENKEFVDIIKQQLEKEEILEEEDCILNNAFQNFFKKEEGKEFIKNLISNEMIIKNNLSIFFIEQLIEATDKNEINDLINFFINDENISKVIKDNIIMFEKNSDNINNILIYSCLNNHNFNYELFTIKILENKNMMEILFKDPNIEDIMGYIFYLSYFNIYTGISNINIIEKILENRNIVEKIYNDEHFSKFFACLSNNAYRKAFDIFFDREIVPKIDKDCVNLCFGSSIQNERIDILEKLFDTELVNKIDDFYILNAITYLCENNKIEFIDILINNNTILEKIINNPNKLTECFEIACDNKYNKIVQLLLSKKQIKDKIIEQMNKEEFDKKIDNMSFMLSCDYNDLSLAKNFIINRQDLLTEKNINELNEKNEFLLYNIFNNKNFNEEDIKIAKILISKGIKINKTNKIVEKNINKIIKNLNKEGFKESKKYFFIIKRNELKLKEAKEAIEDIKKYLNIKESVDNFIVNQIEDDFVMII